MKSYDLHISNVVSLRCPPFKYWKTCGLHMFSTWSCHQEAGKVEPSALVGSTLVTVISVNRYPKTTVLDLSTFHRGPRSDDLCVNQSMHSFRPDETLLIASGYRNFYF
ncbi:hypothetical protein ACF0H5_014578 [Mactra antiquata]